MARAAPRRRSLPRLSSARVASGTRAVPDSSTAFIPSQDWLGGEGSDPAGSSEKRAESIIATNRGLLQDFGVTAAVGRRLGQPGLLVQTSARIGALPLLSPVTGRVDFGLIVEPRFQWSSAGDMLAGMGFRVVPDLLPLPELPQSERRVPPWVLSTVVLARVTRLLEVIQRRFVISEGDRPAPQGAVLWDQYATRRIAHGQALRVPCRYPELRDDEELRSAIHWVVRHHRDALLGQTAAGIVVHQLLGVCDSMLAKLRGSAPRIPMGNMRSNIQRQAIASRVFREGLQAIDWTVDDRGLAGLSDLSGLAWRMDMEVFFEAWVETVADHAAMRAGGRLTVGRRDQTRVPLDWKPPSLGSQRSLVPDIVIVRDDVVVVVDAKYKRHADEIERFGWRDVDVNVREHHREDILQALAYSTLFDAPRIVACLAYPASTATWASLNERGRTMSRARVRSGSRNVEMALLAIPLSGKTAEPAALLERLIKEAW